MPYVVDIFCECFVYWFEARGGL